MEQEITAQPGESELAAAARAEGGHPSADLVVRASHTGTELITDDEMRRMYRLGEALFLSGLFKDVKKAEGAFAKMVIGRDLGLTPMQSMQGLHLVEGGVSVHYATLGHFIRAREGYDFRQGWLKEEPMLVIEGDGPPSEVEGAPPQVVCVWMEEEDPADMRKIVGAVVEYTVGGEKRGVSRFTVDDAIQANLIKDDKRAAWNTSRRNMLLARAMSNGVKWFVPEVLGGLPVYTDGELDRPERASITAPTGSGDDEPQGIDLGPNVDKVIDRASVLGHVGLSNRAALEMALGNRAPAVVNKWVRDATKELDEFEAGLKAQADEAEEAAAVEEEPEPEVTPEDQPEPEPEA